MRKPFIRLLSLVLCAAMLCTLMPALATPAAAAQTKTIRTIHEMENGVISFSDETVADSGIAALSDDTLPQLGAPSELTWGVTQKWVYDETTGTSEPKDVPSPGHIRFKLGSPNLGQVYLEVFKVGEENPCHTMTYRYGVGEYPYEYYYLSTFANHADPESGSYYFTLTTKGDNIQYRNSETVTSDIWAYVKPTAKLAAPTNLYMTGRYAHFDLPEGDNIAGQMVRFYYAKTLADTPYMIGSTTGPYLYDWALQEGGSGYYSFDVKVLSSNLEIICNSEYSVRSEPVYISADNSDLDSIVDSSATMSEDEIRDAVQGIGAEELEKAMLADKTGTEAIAQLSKLEESVGGPAEIQVTEDAYDFDPSKISVVGANLNTAASEDEDITLVVDKPAKDHVIPEAYNNSVAVRFAMDLSNVENTEKLAVPVQITLPIPSNINPEFLAILHYHTDGTFEEITLPYVFSEGGQYYARFVVNGFSDFVLTEYAPEEEEPDADVTRIAGKSRYLTAIAAADVLMETLGVAEFDSIVIASGNEFPDALAGSYLAAVKKAPILLSTKKSDADNLKYIQDNLSSDGTVYILGGTTAVSDSIETMLKTAGINVKRLAGKDRYKTNLLILEEAGFSGGEVLVAIGNNFADSLSASATGKPILLVGPKWDKISVDYVNFLSGKTCSFTIIGGEGAVKEAIETDLKNYGSVRRIFGSNRLQTSVKVAETFFDSPSAAVLACSTNFPDGLCGGPLAYALGAPLLLVNVNKEATPAAYVSANMIKTGFVMGGEAVVSEDSVKAVF